MTLEYLLFDAVVLAPLVAVGLVRPEWFRGGLKPALRAIAVAAVPFIIWDAAVVDRHWWFNPGHVLPWRAFGLPVEELIFFFAVPLACLVFWELSLKGAVARPSPRLRWAFLLWLALALPGAWAWSTGREYTALVLWALSAAAAVDWALGTAVLAMPRGWALVAATLGFTTLFNGYLTARPVVLYDEAYQVPLRVGTIPIEDYGFGLALVLLSTSLYQRQRARRFEPSLVGRLIRWRLGGYRHQVEVPDLARPEHLAEPRTVAVIGAGLAGISAAELLSRRGFQVTLFDKNPYLGGKLASWKEANGEVEHGFHAFFRHYYNLLHWLGGLGLLGHLRPTDDYLLIGKDGRRHSFRELETTPVLNLLALKGRGLYRWRDVMKKKTGQGLERFLRYDPEKTPRELDAVSFASFARETELPRSMMTVFGIFSRAFFSDEARMSMAELVKSFHFYYLSHDHGLLFDHLTASTAEALMDPLRARLLAQGVTLRLGAPVEELGWDGRFAVGAERFDLAVLACDVKSARRLAGPSLRAAAPSLARLDAMRPGQRYAVLRVWTRKRVDAPGMPVFVATERIRALDAFAFADRIDGDARSYAAQGKGSVLELHCYALPDDLGADEVTATMEEELQRFLPGFQRGDVAERHLQLRDDFTAFHVGLWAARPGTESELPGLVLAGDWVALPFPSMLMEGAHTSGLVAANALCRLAGVRTFPVWSVPPRGLLAGRTGARTAASPAPEPSPGPVPAA